MDHIVVYSVKEIFYTLQGEGMNAGRPAVFCRFAGCNLWNGLEIDRRDAVCQFCDTDFVGIDGVNGGRFTNASVLAQTVQAFWPSFIEVTPFVVCTGGEPLLQLDQSLVDAFHRFGFEVAVETNGTLPPPTDLDWICVSPKARAPLQLVSGNELKLVFPQPGAEPRKYERLAFDHYVLQPMDGSAIAQHTIDAADYCLRNPQWRLSLQVHKFANIL